MWFRLSIAMGIPVGELQDRVSSAEFGEYLAYYGIEPFGGIMDSLRAGVVASVVANGNRGKDTKPYQPSDFFPHILPPVVAAPPPSAEGFSLAVFGVDLRKLKSEGATTFVLKRPEAARNG